MADKTIEWLHGVRAHGSEKPWFAYFSTGCSHAPHQVTTEWSDKYKGRFDQGWDKLREETFARQKQLGVIPADAELTPRPEAMPAWDSLDENHRRLYARQMEVYAGYCENADWNIGRVIDAIDEMGELENTLVIYIWGDNGASMEGTLTGTFNELDDAQRGPADRRAAAPAHAQVGRARGLGHRHDGPALLRRLGLGRQLPVPLGQAGRLASRRHPRPDGRPLAEADRRAGRPPLAVHARHRRRPDHPRSRRRAAADAHRRRRAAADARDELPLPRSTTRTPPSGTRSSTSRSSATARCTRTAGGSRG